MGLVKLKMLMIKNDELNSHLFDLTKNSGIIKILGSNRV